MCERCALRAGATWAGSLDVSGGIGGRERTVGLTLTMCRVEGRGGMGGATGASFEEDADASGVC
jgi:hypothetical protein